MKRYVAACSFGKDSMATVILAKKYKEPLDEVVYCEVMFDEETSGEVPEHRDFVYRIAIPRLKRAGIPVHIVRGEKTFVGQFQHRISGEGRSAGKMWSWPLCGKCYVQRDLKVKPINEYLRQISEPITQYIGIGIDEPKRLESLRKKKGCVSLLEKYGYTREMAKEKCMEYGLFSPCYELSNRGGCWFCPNAKLEEQREIKKNYPEVWSQFVSLEDQTDDVAYTVFNPFRRSLHEIDAQLEFDKGGNNGTNTQ